MRYRAMFIVLLVPAVVSAPAQEAPDTRPADGDEAGGPKVVEFEHIRIDREKRQVVFDAEVVLREGMLELFVCIEDTKEHESILATPAEARFLHAGLTALGLTPGRAAHWSDDGGEARFLPPRGPKLDISVRWTDEDGETHEATAADWLKPTDEAADELQAWVFVGSEVLPDGTYWADADGDVISVANFASAVIDVPFESSAENVALEYEARTDAIPPLGTKVEVIVEPLPGATESPYARKLLEIDRLGQLQIDGTLLTHEQLRRWATRFTARHPKGFVRIRADGRALVTDVSRAIREIRIGGIRSYEVQRLPLPDALLPRTTEQAKRDLAEWNEKLATPDGFLGNPHDRAREVVEQTRAEIDRLEARQELLREYAEQVEALRAKHPPEADEAREP